MFSLLALAAAVIVRALEGQGPFAMNASIERVVALQVFLTAITAPLILLAALVEERRRTEELLKQSGRGWPSSPPLPIPASGNGT